MANNTFCFFVANEAGETSQEWRIWSQSNEVYVGARGITQEYKASFHSSGQCQVELSAELRKSLVSDPAWAGKSRLLDTWDVNSGEVSQPWHHLLEILIPDSYLDSLRLGLDPVGVPLPSSPSQITSIALIKTLLSGNDTLESSEAGFRELHRIQLPNASTILVLQRHLPESGEYHAYVRNRFWSHYLAEQTPEGRTYGQKEVDKENPSIRAMLWDGTNPTKYWHEVSARKLFAQGPPGP